MYYFPTPPHPPPHTAISSPGSRSPGRNRGLGGGQKKEGGGRGLEGAEVFHPYGFDFSKIVPANDADMSLPAGPLVKFRDGTLVNDNSLGANTYYIISEGRKRIFSSSDQLTALGYSLENVIQASLSLYEEGGIID